MLVLISLTSHVLLCILYINVLVSLCFFFYYFFFYSTCCFFFFFNDTATTEIYTYLHTLSLHDALPILIAGNFSDASGLSTSLRDLAEKLKRQEHFSNIIVEVSIRGEERWWELSGTPMLDDKRKFCGFRGVGSDVTEKRKSSEKIAYQIGRAHV